MLPLLLTVTAAGQLEPGHSHGDPVRARVAPDRPAKTPGRLPIKTGKVKVETQRKATATALTALTATDQVSLRTLVLAVDDDDFGLATWKATLDRVGASYDVIRTRTEALTGATLVRPDGSGKYNAILLTNHSQLYFDGSGYVSGLDGTEWNTLWAYERDYAVRQVSLYTSYGTWPEDYCLRGVSEGGVEGTPLNATLTAQGSGVFGYVKPAAVIPITYSYVYRTSLQAGCAADPVLQSGTNVLGVRSTSADGRERLALTFTSNQYLLQANLLVYGALRWASRGLFLGEHRRYLSADVDDWFNHTDHLHADGTLETDPGYRLTRADAVRTWNAQNTFRNRPLTSDFRLSLAYNGEGFDPLAPNSCSSANPDGLTSYSRCRAADFRWINHTFTHPKMNFTDYATSHYEISHNTTVGLPVPATVLKTGEYSGLGVYNPDPNDDIGPPTDYGLAASNQNLLQAAKDAGVLYLHGNMSFGSHQPGCFNCGIHHPLEPSLLIVPDWPTNVAYHVTTPAEQTLFYNSYYGPGGRFPYWPADQTYTQILGHESDVALQHVMTGSAYAHTFHQGNLRAYENNQKSLVFDWLNKVLDKYALYYSAPLLTPAWPDLAAYVASRNAHFAALSAGAEALYDRAAGTVTVTSPSAGTVYLTGAQATGFASYGGDSISTVTLPAATPVTVPASVLP
ncbi:hypothetical protein ACIBH1_27520 [Nonomuraea sp. NPDC050663]|uniref:Agd3-related carbohydrate deacetylase n=1 Tax=Nonomuraea sp. NPDC050663 TaxID=3364370 RepID=UPI0037BC25BA